MLFELAENKKKVFHEEKSRNEKLRVKFLEWELTTAVRALGALNFFSTIYCESYCCYFFLRIIKISLINIAWMLFMVISAILAKIMWVLYIVGV
jgi:hypothetical protein